MDKNECCFPRLFRELAFISLRQTRSHILLLILNR